MTCDRCQNSLSLEERARAALKTNLCLGDRARIASERIIPLGPEVKKVWMDTLPTHLKARLALGQDIFKPAIEMDRNNLQAGNTSFNDSGFIDGNTCSSNLSNVRLIGRKEDDFSNTFIRHDFLSEDQWPMTLRTQQLELEVKGLISRVREVREESRGLEDLYTTLVHYRARRALDAPPGRSSRYLHQGVLRCKLCGIVEKEKRHYEAPQYKLQDRRELFQQLPLEVRVALALGKGNENSVTIEGVSCGIEGCDISGNMNNTIEESAYNAMKRGHTGHCSHCGQDLKLPTTPQAGHPAATGVNSKNLSNGNQTKVDNVGKVRFDDESDTQIHKKKDSMKTFMKTYSSKAESKRSGNLQFYSEVDYHQKNQSEQGEQSQSHFYLHEDDRPPAKHLGPSITTIIKDDQFFGPISSTNQEITFDVPAERSHKLSPNTDPDFAPVDHNTDNGQHPGMVLPLLVDKGDKNISISLLGTQKEPILKSSTLQDKGTSLQKLNPSAKTINRHPGMVLPLLVDKKDEHISISLLESNIESAPRPSGLEQQRSSQPTSTSPPKLMSQHPGMVLPLLVDKKDENISVSLLKTNEDERGQSAAWQKESATPQVRTSPLDDSIQDPMTQVNDPTEDPGGNSDPEEPGTGGDRREEDDLSASYSDISESLPLGTGGTDPHLDRSMTGSSPRLSHDSLGSSATASDDDW